MIGVIIGDIVGSRYEFDETPKRSKDFALFTKNCAVADDSLMTLAVAKALILSSGDRSKLATVSKQKN